MTKSKELGPSGPIDHQSVATRAGVFVPVFKHYEQSSETGGTLAVRRSDEARLAEAVGLSAAISLNVVQSGIVSSSKPRPATLIGTL